MSKDIDWLEDRLRGTGTPVIIDGGMGTELEKAGVPMNGNVWSGQAVLTHPESVLTAHEAFINSGAEVIIANTFASARHMLEPGGLGDQVRKINLDAVKLARQARDQTAKKPVAIAGSICEWAPTSDPKWHNVEAVGESCREQAALLAEAGVDLIALEMCEEIEYSLVATKAALDTGLPVWLGMSARTHEGCSSLSVFDSAELDFLSLVKTMTQLPVAMINIMHTPIADIDESLDIVQSCWDGPIGIYPESGYFTMPNWQFVDIIEPQDLVELARSWVARGVRMLGGCCGLGPSHIKALREEFAPD